MEIIPQHCLPVLKELTLRCRPFYLPREFPCVLLTAVYTPLQATATAALEKLYGAISSTQHSHFSIVVGYFNHCYLKSVRPQFYQHVNCLTRGNKTLNHCYPTIKEAYRYILQPYIGILPPITTGPPAESKVRAAHCEDSKVLDYRTQILLQRCFGKWLGEHTGDKECYTKFQVVLTIKKKLSHKTGKTL